MPFSHISEFALFLIVSHASAAANKNTILVKAFAGSLQKSVPTRSQYRSMNVGVMVIEVVGGVCIRFSNNEFS